ncbi:MAG TPA: D-alanine--D-alanine ligase [Flavobacteriales bacterium]|nr:D-alanine--D-alanine ligase [Flavobacteriales bacterium]
MKRNIAIVCGGNSSEYEISVRSGKTVYDNLDTFKYNGFFIEIKGGNWVLKWTNNDEISINKNDFSCEIDGARITFDCVFIAIHGDPGEDGKLQGYFEMLNIPYTGSGILASSLSFDKAACKVFLSSTEVLLAPSITISNTAKIEEKEILDKVGLPCFVKPNKGGSSCGISKVKEKEELIPAIDLAFKEDATVMVEAFIDGRELTCGVFINNNNIETLGVTEIIPKNEFFDYEAKYTEGMAEEITPADIPAAIESECKELSIMMYKTLGCNGIARFDFILSEGKLVYLEVNTVPGLSSASLIPKQADYAGYSLQELFTSTIQEALG